VSGGVKTEFMENYSMEHGTALYLKSNLERGGYIEDVWVRNIKADNVKFTNVTINGILQPTHQK
jgi:polygalacturonase